MYLQQIMKIILWWFLHLYTKNWYLENKLVFHMDMKVALSKLNISKPESDPPALNWDTFLWSAGQSSPMYYIEYIYTYSLLFWWIQLYQTPSTTSHLPPNEHTTSRRMSHELASCKHVCSSWRTLTSTVTLVYLFTMER